jgi:small subunit ribosomal protein S1
MTETEVNAADAADAPAPIEAPIDTPEKEPTGPQPGGWWNAKVTELGDEHVTVDLGDGAIGRFPALEARAAGGGNLVEPGDEIEVLLDEPESDGTWIVSMEKAEKVRVYERIIELAKRKAVVEGVVTRHVRAGLSVDIGVKAILPNRESGFRPHEMAQMVGKTIKAQVVKFDRRNGEVILSRAKVAQHDAEMRKAQLLNRIEVGDVVKGRVVSIRPFGVFVDIGGADGLIHVTELSWDKGIKPESVVKVDEEVEVLIKEIDTQRDRIGLSLKALRDNPWDGFAGKHAVGSRVTGRVNSITEFGIFVTIDGIDGLVHLSELSWDREATDPNTLVSVGDQIEVIINAIEIDRRRLSLSIKRTQPNPWEVAVASLEVGKRVTGPIRNVTDFGVFVEVVPGVEGLLHCGDMSWTGRIEKPADFREFKEGEELEVMILAVDADRNRVSLGLKQIDGDPWESAGDQLKKGGTLEVKISRLAEFGAFAEIVPGLEGLIHISEVAVDRVERLRSHLSLGQEVKVRVLDADRKSRKISLSIKALLIDDGGAREHLEDDEANTSLGALLKKSGHVDE